MKLRYGVARITSAASTWALKNIFKRPAANFPGKAGIFLDPHLIADLRDHLSEGSIVIVGTNGKTTVTNMIANAFEAAGKKVACNRTGANLDSGVATALLSIDAADWGVLECDELWLAKVAPQLRPRYVVLLNLFRDQLDRMGEIDHIQSSVVEALSSSPNTTLVYNCDDPLCQAIADQVANLRIPFGIGEDLHLAQNTVADSGLCQHCSGMLEYEWHQYGQLGAYSCPRCGFTRPSPAFIAHDVELAETGTSLGVRLAETGIFATAREQAFEMRVNSSLGGAYMAYNLLAVCVASACCDIPPQAISSAIAAFTPDNGRLQRYEIDGARILLNLAKNPTGLNQNLRIVQADSEPKAVAIFINDKEADGHDVSWLWDVDFQELAACDNVRVFAGGLRRNDLQVRLKYAGVKAALVEGAADFLAQAQATGGNLQPDDETLAQQDGEDDAQQVASLNAQQATGPCMQQTTGSNMKFYLIANYTALPNVKGELDNLAHLPVPNARDPYPLVNPSAEERSHGNGPEFAQDRKLASQEGNRMSGNPSLLRRTDAITSHRDKLVIAHLYPKLLNLYGDGGNVTILAERARKRGIAVEVKRIDHDARFNLADTDIAFLGGGPDREQLLASEKLFEQADELRAYVEDDGVLLAICGGFQILGREWLVGDETVEGLGIIDVVTKRAEGGSHNRLVGNIALESPIAHLPVIGYENHAGRTYLGPQCKPFGSVVGRHGKGNNDTDGADGVLYRNVVATYLHGPLLSKNPEIADYLIERALARRAAKEGRAPIALSALDDATERNANEFMRTKLGI